MEWDDKLKFLQFGIYFVSGNVGVSFFFIPR